MTRSDSKERLPDQHGIELEKLNSNTRANLEKPGDIKVAFLKDGVFVVLYKNGLLAGFDEKISAEPIWQTRETLDEDNKGKFQSIHRSKGILLVGGFFGPTLEIVNVRTGEMKNWGYFG